MPPVCCRCNASGCCKTVTERKRTKNARTVCLADEATVITPRHNDNKDDSC